MLVGTGRKQCDYCVRENLMHCSLKSSINSSLKAYNDSTGTEESGVFGISYIASLLVACTDLALLPEWHYSLLASMGTTNGILCSRMREIPWEFGYAWIFSVYLMVVFR